MASSDQFEDIARHYDGIMTHVDYDRWQLTTLSLGDLLPDKFVHVDAGCGTATLAGMLRNAGWNSIGIDLSTAMLSAGRKQRGPLPLAAADLRALPFHNSLNLITCLFDSVNFLLDEIDARHAFQEFARALNEEGVLYFDIVTERMVTEHFDGQTWTEENGGFKTTWTSTYNPNTAIVDTHIRVNTGIETIISERIYSQETMENIVQKAGLTLLAVVDALTWKPPTRRTTRMDFIAVKKYTPELKTRFEKIRKSIHHWL